MDHLSFGERERTQSFGFMDSVSNFRIVLAERTLSNVAYLVTWMWEISSLVSRTSLCYARSFADNSLSSTIIETRKTPLSQSASLSFFYFDFSSTGELREESFLRSFIAQTSVRCRNLPAALDNMFPPCFHAHVECAPRVLCRLL
jgi:hypothetical protein